MTTGRRPICMDCKNFHLTETALACAVFESGIPPDVLLGSTKCEKHEPVSELFAKRITPVVTNPAVGNEPRD